MYKQAVSADAQCFLPPKKEAMQKYFVVNNEFSSAESV